MRSENRFPQIVLISIILITCIRLPVFAGEVSLAWDASVSEGVTGYKIYYGNSSGNYNHSIIIGNQTSHTVPDLPDGTYYFAVTAYDAIGNESGYSNEVTTAVVTPDTTPPAISSVESSSITATEATISWTTNEAATAQVQYGLTTAYGSTTTLNSSLQTSHTQALSGLSASTTYHYRVRSTDAAGNLAVSSDRSFTTPALPPPQSPTNLRIVQ